MVYAAGNKIYEREHVRKIRAQKSVVFKVLFFLTTRLSAHVFRDEHIFKTLFLFVIQLAAQLLEKRKGRTRHAV